jgi:hypothetical protein
VTLTTLVAEIANSRMTMMPACSSFDHSNRHQAARFPGSAMDNQWHLVQRIWSVAVR